jgi:hypothetical protein
MKKSIIKKISLIILLNAIAFCTFSQTTIDSSKVDLADTTKTQEMYQLVDGTWITKNQLKKRMKIKNILIMKAIKFMSFVTVFIGNLRSIAS